MYLEMQTSMMQTHSLCMLLYANRIENNDALGLRDANSIAKLESTNYTLQVSSVLANQIHLL